MYTSWLGISHKFTIQNNQAHVFTMNMNAYHVYLVLKSPFGDRLITDGLAVNLLSY